jgi:hypothetical protein
MLERGLSPTSLGTRFFSPTKITKHQSKKRPGVAASLAFSLIMVKATSA